MPSRLIDKRRNYLQLLPVPLQELMPLQLAHGVPQEPQEPVPVPAQPVTVPAKTIAAAAARTKPAFFIAKSL